MTIQMFFGNFADEVDNPVNNPIIYNVEGDNRLSPGVQPLKTGSVLKTVSSFNPVIIRHCLLKNKTFKYKNLRVVSV